MSNENTSTLRPRFCLTYILLLSQLADRVLSIKPYLPLRTTEWFLRLVFELSTEGLTLKRLPGVQGTTWTVHHESADQLVQRRLGK